MTREIRKELIEAKKAYRTRKFEDALAIYEKIYDSNPEEFTKWDRIFYSWTLYQLYIKDADDEDEMFQAAEKVCELTEQEDLNNTKACPYTFTVFKVLDYLYARNDYYDLVFWLEKINPDLLDEKQFKSDDRIFRSKKEKYFDYLTKSYFECDEFEKCIESSKNALDCLSNFTNHSDVWYNWRIAKSLKELHNSKEALNYLEEVLKVKKDWFVQKEMAENYYILGDDEKARKHICNAVLTNDPVSIKVNLYHLAYKILKDSHSDLALKHAELFCAIKMDSDSQIPDDIWELMIDEDNLDKKLLLDEITSYWSEYKFKDRQLQYGTVTKIFDHGKSGFITSDMNESVYFNVGEFKDGDIDVGVYVSYYTEISFDKSKNRESLRAVNIKREL